MTASKFSEQTNRGFTLLELLISLTILSVIMVIIFGAFRISARAWEKGEKNIETNQRERIVLNLMKKQLASASLLSVGSSLRVGSSPSVGSSLRLEPTNIFAFKGDNKSLEFLSYISLVPGNKFGMVYVKYMAASDSSLRLEPTENKERLSFFEKNLIMLNKEFNPADLTEEDFYDLIPRIHSVSFEYLKGTTEEKEFDWQESWEPEKDKGFPFAVKIILKKDEDTPPIFVIVRIEKNESL